MCLNIGTSNNHHFQFGTNVKVVVLGVPILKHFRVVLEGNKRSRTALAEAKYDTQSQQEAKNRGLVYTLWSKSPPIRSEYLQI